ncbi:MAG: AbrB/MazE/SpoVT family DNA-binding domain-containing protein, partial [Nanoarchaeota archaeon]
MRRKLIKQGVNALTVTLPAKWVESNHFLAGDDVDIEKTEHGLLITGRGARTQRLKKINLHYENSSFLRVTLNTLYRMGYERIEISYTSPHQAAQVTHCVQSLLLGFEMTHHSRNLIIIENVTEPNTEKESLLSVRMLYILKESLALLEKDITSGTFSIKEISALSTKLELYDNFCRRAIGFAHFQASNRDVLSWSFYNYLLLLQRCLFHLYQKSSLRPGRKKGVFSKQSLPAAKKHVLPLLLLFDRYLHAFLKKDQELLWSVDESAILFHDIFQRLCIR